MQLLNNQYIGVNWYQKENFVGAVYLILIIASMESVGTLLLVGVSPSPQRQYILIDHQAQKQIKIIML